VPPSAPTVWCILRLPDPDRRESRDDGPDQDAEVISGAERSVEFVFGEISLFADDLADSLAGLIGFHISDHTAPPL
jgi:hypothetical protein